MNFRVSIPYLECPSPVTYLAVVCFRGNTLSYRKFYNVWIIQSNTVSVLFQSFGRHYCFDSCSSIPSTWSRKEFQLDHGRNLSRVEFLTKEFYPDHGLSASTCSQKELTQLLKGKLNCYWYCHVIQLYCSSLTPLTGRCNFCIKFSFLLKARFYLALWYSNILLQQVCECTFAASW